MPIYKEKIYLQMIPIDSHSLINYFATDFLITRDEGIM